MHKRIRLAVAAAAVIGGFAVSQATPAAAVHCVSPEKDSPGFSYFGQDGREDGNPRGASACRQATGSPSERAPGQNK